MPEPAEMLANNRNWARAVAERDPGFFDRLAEQQTPDCLWIGCSDSRVPATQIVDVPPGEIFVHRNVANQVIHSDLNCQSVIQFAVDVLGVRHILICGHYRCSGIAAAAENERHGLVDHWLRNLVDLFETHQALLNAVTDDRRRAQLQAEIGAIQQVSNVATTTTVRDAWSRGQELSIHGWVYDVADGLVKDLNVTIDANTNVSEVIKGAIIRAAESAQQA
jgi:carbonic anhydrase